jgi:hypothetical protein
MGMLFDYLPFSVMTAATDRNDLMPAQEKLEWVTPKISLMGAGDTDSKSYNFYQEFNHQIGPS